MKKIFFILSIAACQTMQAQTVTKKTTDFFSKNKLSITASVGHSKDVPLFNLIGVPNVFNIPVRPIYAIGVEKSYKQTAKVRKYYGAELAVHDYKYVEKTIGFTLIGGFDRKIYKGLYGGLNVGIGYQKAKRADIVYTYINDKWEPSTYPGKYIYNRPNFRFGAELGYHFSKLNMSAFAGANITGLLNVYGPDLPFGIYQTPIKFGLRKSF